MNIVLRDILRYCVFLVLVLVITRERTDANAIRLKKHLENSFIKINDPVYDFSSKVKTSADWWNWTKSVVLQELRAQRDYNGEPPYSLRGFLNDRANRIMGPAIIRQIRSKRHACAAPEPLNKMIDNCSGRRGLENEDSKDFCAGWRPVNETLDEACEWKEFKYKTSAELKTYAHMGRLGWYSGGGYVFYLIAKQQELLQRMDELQRNQWIDKNTRAVLLEFSIYNANVNLFAICTVSAEFQEGGGVIPRWRFEPLKLIKESGLQGIVYKLCEILFVIFLVFFTLKELWELKKLKLSYFNSYWNMAEICILLVSYVTVGLYFYRHIVTHKVLKRFERTGGSGYIRMDSAALIDQYYLYGMATIVFFSLIKLIKLLQFNKRMNVLGLTIKKCWIDLKIYLIAFTIIFFAFTCLFFFMFSNSLQHFSEISSAIQTTFKMMMGKFDSKEMIEVNPMSPILFFIFSLANNMIMINIILTVIIQGFHEVTMELQNQENRLDVIDYVWTSFIQFLRLKTLPRTHVVPELGPRKEISRQFHDENDDSSQLPDKVTQLVQYINEVYLDGKLDVNEKNTRKYLLKKPASEKFVPFELSKQYPEKKIQTGEND